MGAKSTERRPRSVLVYVKADRSVCLEPFRIVETRHERPVAEGDISRNPFKSEQRIQIPTSAQLQRSNTPDSIDRKGHTDEHLAANQFQSYTSTLVFKNIAKNMRWRRLVGLVTRWEVYEEPIEYSRQALSKSQKRY